MSYQIDGPGPDAPDVVTRFDVAVANVEALLRRGPLLTFGDFTAAIVPLTKAGGECRREVERLRALVQQPVPGADDYDLAIRQRNAPPMCAHGKTLKRCDWTRPGLVCDATGWIHVHDNTHCTPSPPSDREALTPEWPEWDVTVRVRAFNAEEAMTIAAEELVDVSDDSPVTVVPALRRPAPSLGDQTDNTHVFNRAIEAALAAPRGDDPRDPTHPARAAAWDILGREMVAQQTRPAPSREAIEAAIRSWKVAPYFSATMGSVQFNCGDGAPAALAVHIADAVLALLAKED